jgi:hypothetical protein
VTSDIFSDLSICFRLFVCFFCDGWCTALVGLSS